MREVRYGKQVETRKQQKDVGKPRGTVNKTNKNVLLPIPIIFSSFLSPPSSLFYTLQLPHLSTSFLSSLSPSSPFHPSFVSSSILLLSFAFPQLLTIFIPYFPSLFSSISSLFTLFPSPHNHLFLLPTTSPLLVSSLLFHSSFLFLLFAIPITLPPCHPCPFSPVFFSVLSFLLSLLSFIPSSLFSLSS